MSLLFARAKAAPTPQQTLAQLYAARDLLERRMAHLERLSEQARREALACAKTNRRNALQALRRKKLMDSQVEQLACKHLSMVQVIGTIESALVQVETIGAMRQAAATLTSVVAATGGAEGVVSLAEELKDQVQETQDIADSLATPLVDVDVDAELDELERELGVGSSTAALIAADEEPEVDYMALIMAASRAPPATAVPRVAEYAQ